MKLYLNSLKTSLSRSLSKIYIVGGTPEVLRIEAIKLIRKYNKIHNFNKSIFFINKNFDWSVIFSIVQNQTLFCEKDLIEIFFIEDINAVHKDNLKKLIEICSSSSNINILISINEVPNNKIFPPKMYKDAVFVPIYPFNNKSMQNWILEKSKILKLSLTNKQIYDLSIQFHNDYNMLKTALFEIKFRKKSDILDNFTDRSINDSLVYDLVDNIIARKTIDSIKIFNDLKEQNIPLMIAFWFINNFAMNLSKLNDMKEKEQDVSAALKECKIPPFKYSEYTNIYTNFPFQTISEIMKNMYNLEKSLKGLYFEDPSILFERIIIMMSDY